jgi:alkylated DNA repair protein alkB family protein 7
LADESLDTTPEIPIIFQRVRHHLQANHLAHSTTTTPIPWLPCHAIDLKKEGELTAHVDSIKFSGNLVAGISLLSASIMRLIPDDGDGDDEDNTPTTKENKGWVDLYLPPLSLYALTGVGRYRYSHQLLPHNSIFTTSDDGTTEIVVERDHRLSVIFRDGKQG